MFLGKNEVESFRWYPYFPCCKAPWIRGYLRSVLIETVVRSFFCTVTTTEGIFTRILVKPSRIVVCNKIQLRRTDTISYEKGGYYYAFERVSLWNRAPKASKRKENILLPMNQCWKTSWVFFQSLKYHQSWKASTCKSKDVLLPFSKEIVDALCGNSKTAPITEFFTL